MKQYYIYKITNLIDNKVYIGQHLSDKDMMVGDKYMGSGLHIKRAIEKYGVKNFKREILACTSTRKNIDILEKYYIGLAREIYDCYNIADGGQGGEVNNNKKVLCVELSKTFESAKDAERNIGLSGGSIGAVLHGRNKTAGGYHWCYVDEENPYLDEQMRFKGHYRKKVLCVELSKTFDSTAEAARYIGLKNRGSIGAVLCGKNKTASGYHWCYVDEENPYLDEQLEFKGTYRKKVLCVETNIVYESISEAERSIGVGHISEVLHGKAKTAGGYHWTWIDEENPYLEEQMKPNKKGKKVLCVETNKTFDSISEATIAMGLKSLGGISAVLNGRNKTAGGYHWEYA